MATSPCFAIHFMTIEPSRTSLEALIASPLPTDGTTKEATFQTEIKFLIAIHRFLLAPMASGQGCHLARQLALTTHCCKRAFVARCTRGVS